MQGIANPRSNLAQSHYSNFFTIKKRVWETLSMTWFFMSRGDRIRTCDLVLPKHPVRNLRQTPQETSEAITYEFVLQGFV